MQNGHVELGSELEDRELCVCYLLGSVNLADIEGNILEWRYEGRTIRFWEHGSILLVHQVVVVVPPGDLAWDDVRGVPVEEDLRYVLMILGSEQEAVLPVLVVVIGNLLVKLVRLIQFERLFAEWMRC